MYGPKGNKGDKVQFTLSCCCFEGVNVYLECLVMEKCLFNFVFASEVTVIILTTSVITRVTAVVVVFVVDVECK